MSNIRVYPGGENLTIFSFTPPMLQVFGFVHRINASIYHRTWWRYRTRVRTIFKRGNIGNYGVTDINSVPWERPCRNLTVDRRDFRTRNITTLVIYRFSRSSIAFEKRWHSDAISPVFTVHTKHLHTLPARCSRWGESAKESPSGRGQRG